MSAAGWMLVAAPVASLVVLSALLRPRAAGVDAPHRLGVVRAALLTGVFAVLTVEVLGALDALTLPAFALAWLLFVAGVAVAAATHRRSGRVAGRPGTTAARTRRAVLVGSAVGGPTAQGPGGGGPRADDLTGDPAAGTRAELPSTAGRGVAAVLSDWAGRLTHLRRTATRGERLLAGGVLAMVSIELVVALLAEPNNFDSQTYHLPKVEHWVAQGSLEFWPTAIHRQVTIPPGAEYLLLHLRLFTGGDALHNLVQWAAGIGCLLAATRITAQLGGGRRAQLLTAFLLATTPMVALQATSTQTDLVAAAWAACAATLVLDGLRRRADLTAALALGAATGLTALTKTSGLIAVGPLLLLWGLAQLRLAGGGTGHSAGAGTGHSAGGGTDRTGRAVDGVGSDPATRAADRPAPTGTRQVARTVGGSLLVLLVAATVVGPFLARETAEFGHPLGPPRLRESIPMERHDPASVLVNALRIGHTAFDTPLAPLRAGTAGAITAGSRAVGVDPQDRAITFGREVFPVPSWYPDEDRVAFPLAGSLALLGALFALARPRRVSPGRPGTLRAYAAVVVLAVVLHTAMIKWQPWGNRLLLYALVLAVPLAGLWVDAVLRRRPGAGRGSVAAGLVVTVLATSALAGVLALSYGFPRRLVGAGSVFTTSEWDTRFLRRPQWADEFRWAASAVRASDARRIGLVQQNDNWEYPWWLLLRGDDGRSPELVALQSVLPDRPPADPTSVDAIVCTGPRTECARLVPAGWTIEYRDHVGYALPPPR
ncbi:phospholipid carrier-dependent glycosyltransferase [Micromonospora sp. RL09-050-HVF-A]|uniref:phospholipid carrier-dependent glycosyltransferase n=1 Tax=Micromonospora sp. RL09-050-HVF-A TaxID=1703433 RepID=UPI001C5CFE83|nr:phospholipid carrier-dependent glycosyltransferase [Micromonospora sp. RL09-050-HVF-A]MBW4703812.1 phospholipid carrier-dependent glycosyltransferase [Micromonospora sp. RL09-050-HVF-A]